MTTIPARVKLIDTNSRKGCLIIETDNMRLVDVADATVFETVSPCVAQAVDSAEQRQSIALRSADDQTKLLTYHADGKITLFSGSTQAGMGQCFRVELCDDDDTDDTFKVVSVDDDSLSMHIADDRDQAIVQMRKRDGAAAVDSSACFTFAAQADIAEVTEQEPPPAQTIDEQNEEDVTPAATTTTMTTTTAVNDDNEQPTTNESNEPSAETPNAKADEDNNLSTANEGAGMSVSNVSQNNISMDSSMREFVLDYPMAVEGTSGGLDFSEGGISQEPDTTTTTTTNQPTRASNTEKWTLQAIVLSIAALIVVVLVIYAINKRYNLVGAAMSRFSRRPASSSTQQQQQQASAATSAQASSSKNGGGKSVTINIT